MRPVTYDFVAALNTVTTRQELAQVVTQAVRAGVKGNDFLRAADAHCIGDVRVNMHTFVVVAAALALSFDQLQWHSIRPGVHYADVPFFAVSLMAEKNKHWPLPGVRSHSPWLATVCGPILAPMKFQYQPTLNRAKRHAFDVFVAAYTKEAE